PFMERMYSAEEGKGAFLNGSTRLKVSTAKEKKDRPVIAFVSWPGCNFNVLKVCQYLEDRGITSVNFCSIGYVEALVANGDFAAPILPGREPQGTAAGQIIVREAAGRATDIFGGSLNYASGKINGHLLSNGAIHDLMVEAVKTCNS